MNLDPSLAFTAIIEMRPGLSASNIAEGKITARLASAMTAANPPDRWEFARAWLDEHYPAKPEREPEHAGRLPSWHTSVRNWT